MKDDLAQALLGSVMGWDGSDVTDVDEELQTLQALARYKYDEYQRFEPGRKFIESLALWLEQFKPEERQVAFEFVKRRLIFVSSSEFAHLANSLYVDVIRPIIRERAAAELGLPLYRVAEVEASETFRELHARSLFLGLSDGARIDAFRRSTTHISNEQVSSNYEPDDDRLERMREALVNALPAERKKDATFKLLFLIDDFTGSGMTLLRQARTEPVGKLSSIVRKLADDANRSRPYFTGRDTEVYVCLYVATMRALDYLRGEVDAFQSPPWNSPPRIETLQILGASCEVSPETETDLAKLLSSYYDPASMEDKNSAVGGTTLEYGFAGCGLPLVLTHNTPNNSLYLLWKKTDNLVALFPRMERHR